MSVGRDPDVPFVTIFSGSPRVRRAALRRTRAHREKRLEAITSHMNELEFQREQSRQNRRSEAFVDKARASIEKNERDIDAVMARVSKKANDPDAVLGEAVTRLMDLDEDEDAGDDDEE